MNRQQLLHKLDKAWTEFTESYAGLSDAQLATPGVTNDWSVKDILAHVTTWEEEALQYLPLIIAGGTPPRYATYGGLDAFNAQKMQQKRALPPGEVLRQLDAVHAQLRDYVNGVPEEQFTRETRFRGSDENLHLTERLTMVDKDTIMYRFTVDNPTAFVRPWTAEYPLLRQDGLLYEYACHEGNSGLVGILKAARSDEAKAAAKDRLETTK